MKRYDVIVVGAGPAGLSAAIEAASLGMRVVVFDENARPGGQLFKQIHKFFGSKEHQASRRGVDIGRELQEKAESLGVEVRLNTEVVGIFEPLFVSVTEGENITSYSAGSIIVASGASENVIPFEGWTLPGVMGAGAAQTIMNLHGVKPGDRVLMVGSGNVGLVVSFQLLQAGCEVAAIVDAAKRVGGYGVHASKVTRTGVPVYTSHTVIKAEGTDCVTGAVIAEVDDKFRPIPGTEKHLDVDTICIAVGLQPMSQLTRQIGCKHIEAGGKVPVHTADGATTMEGLFVAGDVSGIEEASSAMITGRIAALGAAKRGEFIDEEQYDARVGELEASLQKLRKGMFCKENAGRTDMTCTDEGLPLSMALLRNGYLTGDEMKNFPDSGFVGKSGVHPVIECTQNIPCDPCRDACRFGCIHVDETEMVKLPGVTGKVCTGCGMCVAICPGQAIFLVNSEYAPGLASVTLPYEFLPVPQKGERGFGLNRQGKPVCAAQVVDIKKGKAFDKTVVLTIAVEAGMEDEVRFYQKEALEHV